MSIEMLPSSKAVNETSHQTIDVPDTSKRSLPHLYGNRQNYLKFVGQLHESSITGDWERANLIFTHHRHLVGFGLGNLGTSLHVAATTEETNQTINFVRNLVNMMTMDELELKNRHFNTAFWIASASGKMEMAQIMLEKNRNLLDIRGKDDYFPLSIAAKRGSHDIVEWLYNKSNNMSDPHWIDKDRDLTLLGCVENDMFDLALQILEDRPELARNVSVLEVLARKPKAFQRYKRNSRLGIVNANSWVGTMLANSRYGITFVNSGNGIMFARILRMNLYYIEDEEDTDALKILRIIWEHATQTMEIDEIEGMLRGPSTSFPNGTTQYCSRILFVATERGNTEFIVELLRTYPDLMFDTNDDGLTIFHIAVMHRNHCIYNILHEIGDSKNDICILSDKSGNNMLHLVGKTSKEMTTYMPPKSSLLILREITWFNEVEQMIPSYLRDAKNKENQTPVDIFFKKNEYLISGGLGLMKDSMIVATLIVTIAFAVAFTIPGGYNQEHGLPTFIHQRAFIVFVIADAISLFAASFSLIMFLNNLTSIASQRSLMHSLAYDLVLYIPLLAFSIAAIMVTFSASFFVLYHEKLKWVPLFMIFASIPTVTFAMIHIPIFEIMANSMDEIDSLFRPKKRMLYTTKLRSP